MLAATLRSFCKRHVVWFVCGNDRSSVLFLMQVSATTVPVNMDESAVAEGG